MTVAAYWAGNGSSKALTNEEQIALGLGTRKRWYRLKNDPEDRLTLWVNGIGYRVQDDLLHDYGSIPSQIQGWPFMGRWFSKDSYPRSVVLHDAAYNTEATGEAHTLWVGVEGQGTWNKEPVSRETADFLLRVGIIAEGGPSWVAWVYHWCVRKFGIFAWRNSTNKQCRFSGRFSGRQEKAVNRGLYST